MCGRALSAHLTVPRVQRVNSCCRFLQRRSYLVLFTSPSFHGANVSVSPPTSPSLSSPQYAVWVTLWVAWNVFIICFYLDVGGLSKVRLYFFIRFLSDPSTPPPSHDEQQTQPTFPSRLRDWSANRLNV